MKDKILVNKEHILDRKLCSSFPLIKVKNKLGEEILLEKKTARAYQRLKQKLEDQKIAIDLCSGYRSFEEQEKLQNIMAKQDKEAAKKYVAPVGSSEHHTGLCFDIALIINGNRIDENNRLLSSEFDAIFAIIHHSLAEFGLILRYPKGKEKITGYAYEPWHYRYVGPKTAKRIEQQQLTLEEYHEKYNKSGILLIKKPKGMTSFDVVKTVSNIFDTSKVGHNGTLDPLATGVLVITLNQATKINELLTATEKEYLATVIVGQRTDTLDVEGNILEKGTNILKKERLKEEIKNFPKEYLQEVPLYSAKKVNGKKLYEYARNKETVILPKQKVKIKKLELLEMHDSSFTFQTVVSKGTYIRSLIRDLGEACHQLFTMKELIRTKQGKFSIEDAIPLEEVNIDTPLISISNALEIDVMEIPEKEKKKIENGHEIDNSYGIHDKVLFQEQGKDIVIYQKEKDKLKSFKKL